jgi:leader peptidase (prepilin peptidase)/N-methyltransferase
VTAAYAILAAVVGAAIGSFLNVVAYRLPRGESLVRPGSRCPACGAPVRAYDNVPVLSWIMLRGRCRACSGPISRRYPLVETLTAALYAAVVVRYGADRDVWIPLVFLTVLVPVALIDLDLRIIPNRLLAPAAAAAVVLAAALDADSLPERLIAAAAAGGFFLLAALAYPRGMGMGDVKLAATMGLFLGRTVGAALLVALVAGVAIGAAIISREGASKGRKTAVPFGPFLALGAAVAVFAGDAMVDWYLDQVG